MRDVGAGERDVAGLRGLAVEDRFRVQGLLEQLDELFETGGVRAAEVDDVPRQLWEIAGGEDALDDVVDVRVVAAGAAVAEERDRLLRQHLARELVDGEVGPLAGAVDGEEAQRRDFQPV